MCLHQLTVILHTTILHIVLHMLFAYIIDIIVFTITGFVNAQTIYTYISFLLFCISSSDLFYGRASAPENNETSIKESFRQVAWKYYLHP